MVKLTWSKVAIWRAHRHDLDRRAPAGSMLAIAGRLCGLHAQVMLAAELAAWVRVNGLERGDVPRAAWEERTLIKTWAMRGTLHLLPLRTCRSGMARSLRAGYRSAVGWKRWLGITLEDLDALTVAIGQALKGRVLTREELLREVGRLNGSKAQLALNGWGTVLKPAAFAGHLLLRAQRRNARPLHAAGYVAEAAPPAARSQCSDRRADTPLSERYAPATECTTLRAGGAARA